jgi:DNA-binding NtrC family response regulator
MSDTRILFVDDETEVRRSAAEWLTLSGFSVETAADVAEARTRTGPAPPTSSSPTSACPARTASPCCIM